LMPMKRNEFEQISQEYFDKVDKYVEKNPENSGVLLVVVSKSGKDEGCSITNVAAHNTYVMINLLLPLIQNKNVGDLIRTIIKVEDKLKD